MNNKVNKFIIECLNAFWKGQVVDLPTDMDNELLFRIAKEQQVAGIVYNCIKDKGQLGQVQGMFNQNLFQSIMLATMQKDESSKLQKFCERNDYPYALLKGMYVKDLYPTPELRVMGDIDILINPKDLGSISEFLEQSRYKKGEISSTVESYHYNAVHFEIHKTLNQYGGITLFDYKDIVSNELPTDKHFAFLFDHLAKHIYSAGCGIRMLYDIAVFYKSKNVDMDAVYSILSKVGLAKFCDSVMSILDYWFDLGLDRQCDIDFALAFESYVFGNGAYGFENLSTWQLKQNNNGNKIKTIFRILFPKKRDMYRYYSQLEQKPYLLGYYYVARLLNRLKMLLSKKYRKSQSVSQEADTKEQQPPNQTNLDYKQTKYIKDHLNLD